MRLIPILAFVVLAAGCGDEPDTAKQPEQAPPPPKTEQERLINNTQAASAVGYDGQAVKRQVQKTVDINNDHNAKIEEAANAAGLGDPDAAKPDEAK